MLVWVVVGVLPLPGIDVITFVEVFVVAVDEFG